MCQIESRNFNKMHIQWTVENYESRKTLAFNKQVVNRRKKELQSNQESHSREGQPEEPEEKVTAGAAEPALQMWDIIPFFFQSSSNPGAQIAQGHTGIRNDGPISPMSKNSIILKISRFNTEIY